MANRPLLTSLWKDTLPLSPAYRSDNQGGRSASGPQEFSSAVSYYASCTDSRQSMCQEWPVRCEIASPGTQCVENRCNLQSATRRS